jgi:two-component system nitrate/nitrite response regulator NarL
MEPLSLLLVSDDPLARAGLAYLLTEQLPHQIVDQMTSQAWFDQPDLDGELPDVLVWDVGWEFPPSVSELELSDLPILTLVSDAELAAEIWAAGIRAIVQREIEPEQVDAALQAVVKGLVVLDPTFVARLSSIMSSREADMRENLTPRELEVLRLLAEGKTNKAIAQELEVSSHTVKFHVTSLMGKLNAQSRTEAVVRATRLGLIAL